MQKELPFKEQPSVKKKSGYQQYEDYKVMLNLSDVSFGTKGHNKFYEITLYRKEHGLYLLVTKWGRVGAKNPQSQNFSFSSKFDAIKEFKDKFFEKTHNDWDNRDRFLPIHYYILSRLLDSHLLLENTQCFPLISAKVQV